MGMVGNYLRVLKNELEEYMKDSGKLEDRVYSENNVDDKNLIYVDKAWEGIFFLLTGASLSTMDNAKEPLSLILNTTLEIDPEQDMGYGPAMYNTIEQTKEISLAMNNITLEDLRGRYDAAKMTDLGVYPDIWDEENAIEYLIEYYTNLKIFYNAAAQEGQAVIFFVN